MINASAFIFIHIMLYQNMFCNILKVLSFGMECMYAYSENTPVNASNYTGNVPEWVKKLKRRHYEYYDNDGDWVFKVNGGYTSSVTYFAYWD